METADNFDDGMPPNEMVPDDDQEYQEMYPNEGYYQEDNYEEPAGAMEKSSLHSTQQKQPEAPVDRNWFWAFP